MVMRSPTPLQSECEARTKVVSGPEECLGQFADRQWAYLRLRTVGSLSSSLTPLSLGARQVANQTQSVNTIDMIQPFEINYFLLISILTSSNITLYPFSSSPSWRKLRGVGRALFASFPRVSLDKPPAQTRQTSGSCEGSTALARSKLCLKLCLTLADWERLQVILHASFSTHVNSKVRVPLLSVPVGAAVDTFQIRFLSS